eukprot:g33448.t1
MCHEFINEKVHQLLSKLEVHMIGEVDWVDEVERLGSTGAWTSGVDAVEATAEERMSDQELFEKNQRDIVESWSMRDLWRLVPGKLILCLLITRLGQTNEARSGCHAVDMFQKLQTVPMIRRREQINADFRKKKQKSGQGKGEDAEDVEEKDESDEELGVSATPKAKAKAKAKAALAKAKAAVKDAKEKAKAAEAKAKMAEKRAKAAESKAKAPKPKAKPRARKSKNAKMDEAEKSTKEETIAPVEAEETGEPKGAKRSKALDAEIPNGKRSMKEKKTFAGRYEMGDFGDYIVVQSEEKVFSMEEVALHSSPEDCWVVLHGRVYDLTKFAMGHVGGSKLITDLAGKDRGREKKSESPADKKKKAKKKKRSESARSKAEEPIAEAVLRTGPKLAFRFERKDGVAWSASARIFCNLARHTGFDTSRGESVDRHGVSAGLQAVKAQAADGQGVAAHLTSALSPARKLGPAEKVLMKAILEPAEPDEPLAMAGPELIQALGLVPKIRPPEESQAAQAAQALAKPGDVPPPPPSSTPNFTSPPPPPPGPTDPGIQMLSKRTVPLDEWPPPSAEAVQQMLSRFPQLDGHCRGSLMNLPPQFALAILWDMDAKGALAWGPQAGPNLEEIRDPQGFVFSATQTLLRLPMGGSPLGGSPLGGSPLGGSPLCGSPLGASPLGGPCGAAVPVPQAPGGVFSTTALRATVRRAAASAMALRVGLCQMTARNDKERPVMGRAINFQICRDLVSEAASQGCTLVALPECFAFIGAQKGEAQAAAEALEGPTMHRYCELAKEKQLWLSLGGFQEKLLAPFVATLVASVRRFWFLWSCPVRARSGAFRRSDVTPGVLRPRILNTHVIVNSLGEIASVYRKIHLFDAPFTGLVESQQTVAGTEVVSCASPVGQLGVTVCYDVRFPELYQKLRFEHGAERRLGRAARGSTHLLMRTRAVETQCYVIAAAQAGQHNEDGNKRCSWGHAMAVDPWGKVLAEFDGSSTGVRVVEVDQNVLQDVRQKMPLATQRRYDIYGRTS